MSCKRSDHINTKSEELRPDAEWLTVETTCEHLELLEVRECTPFRRDSAGELVRLEETTAADVEHLE